MDLYAAWQLCPATEQAARKAEFDTALRAFTTENPAVRKEAIEALVRRLWDTQKRTEEVRKGQGRLKLDPPTS